MITSKAASARRHRVVVVGGGFGGLQAVRGLRRAPVEQQQVVERFLAALTEGEVQGLMDVLAPGVVLVADGGGVVPAAIRPVSGAKTVARLLSRFSVLAPGTPVGTTWLNGAPALRIDPAGEFDTAVSLTVEDGRIARIYAIRNPHKLGRLEDVAELRR
jgi:hypothetical protein